MSILRRLRPFWLRATAGSEKTTARFCSLRCLWWRASIPPTSDVTIVMRNLVSGAELQKRNVISENYDPIPPQSGSLAFSLEDVQKELIAIHLANPVGRTITFDLEARDDDGDWNDIAKGNTSQKGGKGARSFSFGSGFFSRGAGGGVADRLSKSRSIQRSGSNDRDGSVAPCRPLRIEGRHAADDLVRRTVPDLARSRPDGLRRSGSRVGAGDISGDLRRQGARRGQLRCQRRARVGRIREDTEYGGLRIRTTSTSASGSETPPIPNRRCLTPWSCSTCRRRACAATPERL